MALEKRNPSGYRIALMAATLASSMPVPPFFPLRNTKYLRYCTTIPHGKQPRAFQRGTGKRNGNTYKNWGIVCERIDKTLIGLGRLAPKESDGRREEFFEKFSEMVSKSTLRYLGGGNIIDKIRKKLG